MIKIVKKSEIIKLLREGKSKPQFFAENEEEENRKLEAYYEKMGNRYMEFLGLAQPIFEELQNMGINNLFFQDFNQDKNTYLRVLPIFLKWMKEEMAARVKLAIIHNFLNLEFEKKLTVDALIETYKRFPEEDSRLNSTVSNMIGKYSGRDKLETIKQLITNEVNGVSRIWLFQYFSKFKMVDELPFIIEQLEKNNKLLFIREILNTLGKLRIKSTENIVLTYFEYPDDDVQNACKKALRRIRE